MARVLDLVGWNFGVVVFSGLGGCFFSGLGGCFF